MADPTVDLTEFPWEDPADTGFTSEPFNPETDVAPEGGPFDCTGHGDEDGA